MEIVEIIRKKTDETGEETTLTLKGRIQKRIFLNKNGIYPKVKKPVVRIMHKTQVKYSPPPRAINEEIEYPKKDEDCRFFTIMSINNGLEYATIVNTDTDIFCFKPNIHLSKPGLYKFEMPVNGEKFDTYGKVKIYKVRIIEQIGM